MEKSPKENCPEVCSVEFNSIWEHECAVVGKGSCNYRFIMILKVVLKIWFAICSIISKVEEVEYLLKGMGT